ncbi:hypothetical protein [Gorillibacterium sp. sgz5001074]|uniref:hypothetical protein n=1 Tax=Gorillibacterium sp. sgz5001074 TaxID=3446695 RepID=UPI003F672F16
MENVVYDDRFNGNEWLVLGLMAAGLAGYLILPKRFSPMAAWFNLLIGVVIGLLFDHTIAVPPFDLYDVGDEAQYQWFDVLSYGMYAPFGYFFIYGIERFRLRSLGILLYIAVWALGGVGLEWVCETVGVFHYKNGYRLLYSLPIYFVTESLHLVMYRRLFKRH